MVQTASGSNDIGVARAPTGKATAASFGRAACRSTSILGM